MPKWTKETALTELDALIGDADAVARQGAFSSEHARWVLRTKKCLSEVFGQKSDYFISFAILPWTATESCVIRSWNIQEAIEEHKHRSFLKQVQTAKGILQAAHDDLNSSALEDVYDGRDTPQESSAIIRLINLVEHRLRKAIRKVPDSESDVQDTFEKMLLGTDIDFTREVEIIEYSSKIYRPDFAFKQLDFVIEFKFCARSGREKEIIAEINDDILAYQTVYRNLLFVVYDVGKIRDSDKFCGSFESHENVMARVVKH